MIPIYDVTPLHDNELTAVALVDAPAIERSWMAFQEQKQVKLSASPRRIVTGPLLIPDQLIYRNEEGLEFYLRYTKEAIEHLHLDFMRNRRTSEINLMHNSKDKPNGVFIYEIFQADEERGIMRPTGFEDLPDGTLFASAKIENDETWAGVENGDFIGFSIEAWVTPVKVEQVDHELALKFCQAVEALVNK